MPRGPAVYGVKWEKSTSNGYRVRVVRDPDMEDLLRSDLELKRSVYHVVVLDGDETLELYHEFNLSEAVARGKLLANSMECKGSRAKRSSVDLEDYL